MDRVRTPSFLGSPQPSVSFCIHDGSRKVKGLLSSLDKKNILLLQAAMSLSSFTELFNLLWNLQ